MHTHLTKVTRFQTKWSAFCVRACMLKRTVGMTLHESTVQREFLKYVAHQLQIERMCDWYKISVDKFLKEPSARQFLNIYSKSRTWHEPKILNRISLNSVRFLLFNGEPIQRALVSLCPDFNWKPWLFDRVPCSFWNCEAHRKEFVEWFSKENNIHSPQEWYSLQINDLKKKGGSGFIEFYGGSLYKALSVLYPQFEWKAWLFGKVGGGFWDDQVSYINTILFYRDYMGRSGVRVISQTAFYLYDAF